MDFVTGEVLAIDKPLGWTSFDAVKRIRGAVQRRLGVRKFKVGHAGTLDPLATGVLIICTGRATRTIDTLQAGRKEYVAVMRLGATTPSFDLEKEIDATYPYEHVSREMILGTLPRFTGHIMQVPPVFSAVKVDGRRAYLDARKGREVELSAKPLVIDEFELLDFDGRDMTLRIVCSKGTYIRALARDLGYALGSGAHLVGLRRTSVGLFRVEGCMSVDEAVRLIDTTSLELPDEWLSEHPLPAPRRKESETLTV
ncbi:MAG: tRNA pseudouridine(55) synthase TruB [Muribaculaceae bacterium]|nr:tRNA pseudouridine(55) synthase TruB [Muribaculaceae bacterium]